MASPGSPATLPASHARPGRADDRSLLRVDLLVAAGLLLALAVMGLLTPVFTDFEAEAEPALKLLAAGQLSDGIAALPLYGGAVLLMAPFAWLAHQLGGGDVAVFRAVAVPGAIAIALLAVTAARWVRAAGRSRSEQLAAVLLIAASPGVAHAWQVGHPEEPLIAGLAIAGVILAARGEAGFALAGGALAGLAAGSKLWAVVVIPVAILAAPTLGLQLRAAGAAAVAGAVALVPTVLSLRDQFTRVAQATGGDGVFNEGNVWWFLGRSNPNYRPAGEGVEVVLQSAGDSARIGPEFAIAHAHELIVGVAVVLSLVWWWRQRAAPAGNERLASVLTLLAAVLWWRALLDPWFQPYYLTAGLAALVLADARLGRRPIAAAAGWALFWLVSVQNAPLMGVSPDLRSALTLGLTVPVGIWLVARALRPVR